MKQFSNRGLALNANDYAVLPACLRLDGAGGNDRPHAIGLLVPQAPLSRGNKGGKRSTARGAIRSPKERVSELIQAPRASDLKLPPVFPEIGWRLC